MHAFPHLSAVDGVSLAVFVASWAGYAWYSEHSRQGAGGLNRTSQQYRLLWAYRMLARVVRVMDSTLVGTLMTSVSFYANTTIYIIAGLVAALGASDKLVSFTADLPFAGAGNRELLEIKLMLVLSLRGRLFKFTWSIRQFNLAVHPGRAAARQGPNRATTPTHAGWPAPTACRRRLHRGIRA
jgi:uncharacterized membrane protein